jgi:hypothetical protein
MSEQLEIENEESENDLMTVQEYAAMVRKSPKTIYNQLSNGWPADLPVSFTLPYHRGTFFSKKAVKEMIRNAEKRAIEDREAKRQKHLPIVRRSKEGNDGD